MLTKFQKTRILFFLSIFSLIGLNLVWQCGIGRGLLLMLLTWSFYLFCVPLSNNALITALVLRFFTKKNAHVVMARHVKIIPWALAIGVNLFAYFVVPYMYLMSATTFLLYRIISKPWPYWIIIAVSGLIGLYNLFIIQSAERRFFLKHLFARTVLFSVGIATFIYLSYIELIIFFCASTC